MLLIAGTLLGVYAVAHTESAAVVLSVLFLTGAVFVLLFMFQPGGPATNVKIGEILEVKWIEHNNGVYYLVLSSPSPEKEVKLYKIEESQVEGEIRPGDIVVNTKKGLQKLSPSSFIRRGFILCA